MVKVYHWWLLLPKSTHFRLNFNHQDGQIFPSQPFHMNFIPFNNMIQPVTHYNCPKLPFARSNFPFKSLSHEFHTICYMFPPLTQNLQICGLSLLCSQPYKGNMSIMTTPKSHSFTDSLISYPALTFTQISLFSPLYHGSKLALSHWYLSLIYILICLLGIAQPTVSCEPCCCRCMWGIRV